MELKNKNTKLAKIENEHFAGFYDEVIHNLKADGKIYFSISNEEWEYLLNGQTSGKEIRILKDGTLGLYEKPINNLEGVNIQFNYESEKWEETATLEEQIEYYYSLILEKTKELEIIKIAGFIGSKEEIDLEKEIPLLKQKHLELQHELGLEMNKSIKTK